VVRIAVPPLRDRPEDVEALLDHFLACFAERHGRTAEIDAEVRGQLSAYPWPGNVRELVSFVERLYATGLPARVLAEALLAEHAEATVDDEGDEAPLSLAEAEQWAIRRAMQAAQGSVQEAAKLLQVHRSTLSRKLKQAGVA
jgi:transcriptional regulator with PAS, ATPase and Fis domain